MRYTCDDYKELKSEHAYRCTAGMYGEEIYAICIFVSDEYSGYYDSYYKITKEEFETFPDNADALISKYSRNVEYYLCSTYMDKSHPSYGFDYPALEDDD